MKLYKKSKKYHLPILLALICIIVAFISSEYSTHESTANQFEKVIVKKVIDGDTIRVEGGSIRLWGIDAPELDQKCEHENNKSFPCGRASRLALLSLLESGDINCKIIDIDRYQRGVGQCYINDMDINNMMVLSGWAVEYKKYSLGYYHLAQQEAKAEKRGLWKTDFVMPWEWRRQKMSANF